MSDEEFEKRYMIYKMKHTVVLSPLCYMCGGHAIYYDRTDDALYCDACLRSTLKDMCTVSDYFIEVTQVAMDQK